MFGGANGKSTKYEIKNDTYIFETETYRWHKINTKGDIPPPRAAHSACPINEEYLAIFGGTDENNEFLPDNLYILKISQNYENCIWNKIINYGKGPGSRYGHKIIYKKPYLLIIGGNLENTFTDEIHYTLIDENNILKKLKWYVLNIDKHSPFPSPRIYQTCSICKYGKSANMIFLYGGRNEKGLALNDCWGLKNTNEKWEWIKIPYNKGYEPQSRFQHSSIFFYHFLINIGGRNNNSENKIYIEIFDTNNYKWEKTEILNKFRHSCWIINDFIYIQGGFNLNNPNYAQSDIIKIDVNQLFNINNFLKNELTELKNKINMPCKNIDEKKLFDKENLNIPIKKKEIEQEKLNNNLNQNINIDNRDTKEKAINLKEIYIHSVPVKYLKNMINIKFCSVYQDIDYYVICNRNDKFYIIEEKLYEKYPEYLDTENYFMVNGIKINKYKTIEQNKIKNGDMIVLKKVEEDD